MTPEERDRLAEIAERCNRQLMYPDAIAMAQELGFLLAQIAARDAEITRLRAAVT